MITKLYSIYDAKAEAYLAPFSFTHDGQAVRTFTDTIQEPTHQFSKHPEDYTLFSLGTFDDSNAEIATTTPKSLGNGLQFVTSEPTGPIPADEIHGKT